MIKRALEIAKTAHTGQVDKAGIEYINHPIKVASYVDGEEEKIVAYLHDVVEDTSMTLEDLRNEGFKEEIIFAIDCLTKRKNEDLDTYLHRVIQSPLAYKVKLADMKHNAEITRFKNPSEKDIQRAENYIKRRQYLMELYAKGQ